MSDTAQTAKSNPIGRALMWVLAFQLGLAGLLFWGDLRDGLRLPGFGPRAPELTDPVRPGDQTRRFRPDRAPPGGRPMPSSPLPDRLTLTVVEGGQRALLEGGIVAGDAERIEKQLAGLDPKPQGVILNSPGGSVQDALLLGRYLRDADLTTALRSGDVCYSACPYLLAAGTRRTIPDDASVGVHQHYFGESTLLPAFVAVEERCDLAQVDAMAARHLARYKQPRIVQQVPALPRNPNGKLIRAALPQLWNSEL